MQIVLLSGLATFYWFVYTGPSGQTYAYFYGVALLVLKGNAALFFANLFFSFVGPCMFYVNYTNLLLHGCLNLTRKVVLLVQNLLFLLVRVLTITSTIFIPVINHWMLFVGNHGDDASTKLDNPLFAVEFQKYFSKGLDAITVDIRKNALLFVAFVLIHLMLVASHALLCSGKFGVSMMRERLMHLVSSFWLPLPFLTIRQVDRDDQKAELCFLVVLHSLENLCLLLISRWAYNSYPLGQFLIHIVVAVNIFAAFFSIINRNKFKVCTFVLLLICMVAFNISAAFLIKTLVKEFVLGVFVIDLCLVIVNVLGIIVSNAYQLYVKLYAGVPQTFPDNLPSFGPEDVPTGPVVDAEREYAGLVEEGQGLADAGQIIQQELDVETQGPLTEVTVENEAYSGLEAGESLQMDLIDIGRNEKAARMEADESIHMELMEVVNDGKDKSAKETLDQEISFSNT